MKIKSLLIKGILIAVCLLPILSQSTYGQQDPLYAQYLNNPIVINPAYTGFNKLFNVTAQYRSQWGGFDNGSPQTALVSAHSSFFDNRAGAGLIIVHDQIGISRNTEVSLTYSYKIGIGDYNISFGLQTGIINFRNDLTDLNPSDPTDELFLMNESTTQGNFGTGLIVSSEKLFFGLSIPRLVKNEIELADINAVLRQRHFYVMMAYYMDLNLNVKFKPSILLRAVDGAPASVDYNVNFIVNRKYTIGLLTRNFDSYGLLMQFQLDEAYRFGYVFELPTGSSVGTNFTTHEITLGLDFALFDFQEIFQRSF
ncbi:MAG: type IX secretion system membrane protein PorP/SprF [Bacteroidota bacterium]